MKIIGFSVKEILYSLLNKTKKQTIRPAWKWVTDKNFPIRTIEEKPPRFRVGDIAQIVWKPRTKKQLFCPNCGNVFNRDGEHPFCDVNAKYWNETSLRSKKLGIVEIIKVLKIEMKKSKKYGYLIPDKKYGKWADSNVNELALLDGFKSAEEMFELFDKMYDLNIPREFHVYRWKWLN